LSRITHYALRITGSELLLPPDFCLRVPPPLNTNHRRIGNLPAAPNACAERRGDVTHGQPLRPVTRYLSQDSGSDAENLGPVRAASILVLYTSFDIIPVKPVEWLGDSLERIRDFPGEARREAGYQLARIQAGKEPVDWKPMRSVGLGVSEIRVREGGAFRVIYVAKCPEAVYVLHAFQKTSRKTAKADIQLARQRFKSIIEERKRSWTHD